MIFEKSTTFDLDKVAKISVTAISASLLFTIPIYENTLRKEISFSLFHTNPLYVPSGSSIP